MGKCYTLGVFLSRVGLSAHYLTKQYHDVTLYIYDMKKQSGKKWGKHDRRKGKKEMKGTGYQKRPSITIVLHLLVHDIGL
jgi:hypothetical protein